MRGRGGKRRLLRRLMGRGIGWNQRIAIKRVEGFDPKTRVRNNIFVSIHITQAKNLVNHHKTDL